MSPRRFTRLSEHSREELLGLVESARALKQAPPRDRPLSGLSVALCFMNPSLRTQTSFQVAAASLGAHPVTLSPGAGVWQMEAEDGVVMDGAAAEHLKEAVPVLSRYCDALALRSFPAGKSWAEDAREPHLSAFIRHAAVPVINMESATGHPCQALADWMTIRERMAPEGRNFLLAWAPHIKGLPLAVPSSAAEMAALAGMNVTVARPPGFDLPPEVMARVEASCRRAGARLRVLENPDEAYRGAHVVYAKAWGSLERYGAPPPQDPAFRRRWMVDAEKMSLAESAVFMHCLPVRRNLVVADAVLDSPASIVVDQAENRLHTAKAVLLHLMTGRKTP